MLVIMKTWKKKKKRATFTADGTYEDTCVKPQCRHKDVEHYDEDKDDGKRQKALSESCIIRSLTASYN